jgi:hypothetical protein
VNNDFFCVGDECKIQLDRKDGSKLYAIIDLKDLDRVKQLPSKWSASWCESSKTFYVIGNPHRYRSNERVKLHRWITDAPPGKDVDHFDHNGLNNRGLNLSVTSRTLNNFNTRGAPKHNISTGIKGVNFCYLSKKNPWRATITIDNKSKHLGLFPNKESAEKAYRNAVESRIKELENVASA